MSVYSRSTLVAFISSFGVILAATYMLLLYKKVFLGPINSNLDNKINQLHVNETITFLALSIMILIIGIKPNLILSYTTSSLDRIVSLYPITIFKGNVLIILPEIILSIGFLLLLCISPFIKTDSHKLIGYLSLLLIFLTQFSIVKDIFIFEEVFEGFFIIDSFGSFLKLIILISAGLSFILLFNC